MPRKKKEVTVEVKEIINPITLDFQREDLNLLRDKVNEIIAVLNEKDENVQDEGQDA